MTEHESSLCAPSAGFPPSIVSGLLRLFYLGEQGFGCDGGSTGEVVTVAVMVVAVAAGKRGERVTCWTTFLCSCGGWCRLRGWGVGGGWRAEQDHHCIAGHHEWPIVRGVRCVCIPLLQL